MSGIYTAGLVVGVISAMVQLSSGGGAWALPGGGASAAGSGAPAGDNRGQQFLSPPCRGSDDFRLMRKW